MLLFVFSLSAYFSTLSTKPELILTKQDEAINYNSNFLSVISLGNKRMLADWLWIQTLIESDVEHYKGDDYKNWMFLRFSSIINLDENFLAVYQYGGQYLSIVKDDDMGAKEIFDRGLLIFPNDYLLNLNAAFHYHYELSEPYKALIMYERLVKNYSNVPPFVLSSIAKIRNSQGNLDDAKEMLIVMLEKYKNDSFMSNRIQGMIDSIQIQKDLDCLNSKAKDCKLAPPHGYQYLPINGLYTTNKPYKKFKVKNDQK